LKNIPACGGSPYVSVIVPETGSGSEVIYSTAQGTGDDASTYRTCAFIRLVSNDVDHQLNAQLPKVQLGNHVVATLYAGGGYACSKCLPVGLPSSETTINAIRTATAHFFIVNYSDVAAKVDLAKTAERMTQAWAQAAVKFSWDSTTVTPVRNIILIDSPATESGDFSITIDGTAIPAFEVGQNGRVAPFQIAQDIAAGINRVLGANKASAFNTWNPAGSPPVAHVVVKKGSNVTFTDLNSLLQGTKITVPAFSTTDDLIEKDEQVCLAANYGDGNPNTIDFFVVKMLLNNRASGWPAAFCGDTSDMRNTSFIRLEAADGSANNPYTAAHEAGRFFLNFKDLDTGEYNLMNRTSATDTVAAHKRLTPDQHQTSRSKSDGGLLKP
jgi:hypothetical protein